jgi:outer membrane protein OmpA-like peptidoglycan-associated protein
MTHASWLLAAVAVVLLSGCAGRSDEQVLAEARADYQRVSEDAEVLRSAPKDVVRAGESLGRAERLAGYLGNGDDVRHYAYLSQRYSSIAREHQLLDQNQQRAAQLAQERDRLRLLVRESQLISVQQQNSWLEEQMVNLATSETERGLVMTLGDVLFEPGEAGLNRSANRTLLKLGHFLQLNPKRRLRIEGYTDSLGKAAENLELSRQRAQAVADMLEDIGIDPQRLQVVGHGEAYPLTDNASNKGRAQNRRVEIVISDPDGELGAER